MESSPESMRGASAEIVVPVASAAMVVSSPSSTSRERVLALIAAGSLTFGFFCGALGVACGTLPADRGFDGPTATRSGPWKKLEA